MRGADHLADLNRGFVDPLPPHARGRLGELVLVQAETPSTPACARLTQLPASPAAAGCLYPRVRGADSLLSYQDAKKTPLPPHARG